jgi:hypothetical protein
MSDSDESHPGMWVADVIGDGPETKAVVSLTRIAARDLNEQHIGKYLGCCDPSIGNYPSKILKVVQFPNGRIPLISVWFRHPDLPNGTPARNDRTDVPFDFEFDLVELMTW